MCFCESISDIFPFKSKKGGSGEKVHVYIHTHVPADQVLSSYLTVCPGTWPRRIPDPDRESPRGIWESLRHTPSRARKDKLGWSGKPSLLSFPLSLSLILSLFLLSPHCHPSHMHGSEECFVCPKSESQHEARVGHRGSAHPPPTHGQNRAYQHNCNLCTNTIITLYNSPWANLLQKEFCDNS